LQGLLTTASTTQGDHADDINIAIPKCFPHMSHLESYPHHHGPLDVVGLGEGRPPNAGTDVPDNGLDLVVTMVPVRGGRVTPPVKAAISIDPAVGAFTPVWAAPPTWSIGGASTPIWATAIAPLGVRGCPLRCVLSHCLSRQLELVVDAIVS
jgi:hypothetical protein